MKERPILFSAPMVRAILDGSKTQTRRVVKRTEGRRISGFIRYPAPAVPNGMESWGNVEGDDVWMGTCPYGQPGDRLWVRETWNGPFLEDLEEYRLAPEKYNNSEHCEYAADGGPAPEYVTMDDELVQRWRPSIHMPRWASRIMLEITGVRVERLQDISYKDALAEGIESVDPDCHTAKRHMAIQSYAVLWDSINGAGAWDVNPLVWVVEFK